MRCCGERGFLRAPSRERRASSSRSLGKRFGILDPAERTLSASLWRAPKEAARGVVCVDEALGRAREWSLSLKGNGLGALVSFFCELPFEFRHAMIQPADELLGSHLLCGQDVEPGLEAQKSPRRTGCGFWGLTLCRRVGRIRHERCASLARRAATSYRVAFACLGRLPA